MRGTFESVTKVAIEEIIRGHAQESKFGYVLSPDSFKELTADLFELLLTSRNLKSAGDRLITGAAMGSSENKKPHASERTAAGKPPRKPQW